MNIETIRRRAKDNKADNVKFYLKFLFNTVDKLRNLLATFSIAIFGFIQATNIDLETKKITLYILLWSLIAGGLNYFFSYCHAKYEADYNSKIEKIFSRKAYPTLDEYNEMTQEEDTLLNSKNNPWWIFSLSAITFQFGLIIYAIEKLI